MEKGVCIGVTCTVVESEQSWIFDCPDGSSGAIPRGGASNGSGATSGAGAASGATSGGTAGRPNGAAGEESAEPGAGAAGEAMVPADGGAFPGGTGGLGEPSEPVAGEGGAAVGGSGGEAGAGEGGMAGAAGGAACPGAAECPCSPSAGCDQGLVCRARVCAALPEPATAVTEGHFELPPGPFEVVLDSERGRVFASYGGDGVVRVLNLDDGEVALVTTGHRAEHMFFDEARDEVLVSLPVQNHSAYLFDESQEGYVGAINAITLADPDPIWIPIDPWQILGDGRGHAIVSGASGQWTSMMSVDLETGWYQATRGPYHGTNIRLHPARDRFYGANNGLSPSDIERYDVSAEGVITSSYDSPYHGDYAMCGDLRIHPSGNTIYTPCGNIFLASNSQSTDMTFVADMGLSWIDLGFDSSGRYALVLTANARALYVYDTETLSPGTALPVQAADRILVGSDYIVLIRQAVRGVVPFTDVELLRLQLGD
ncbi:MAG TPA: hypothetical protein VER33_25130 [Polyangiaceae bacterium]|nr:hypothetical protein [Polyangiaceae bacterium]